MPRAVVIISSSRSGSNLLVKYLRQVQGAASFGEIFREDYPTIAAWTQLTKRLDLPADVARLHGERLIDFWELVLSQVLARKRWASAKIFYYHRRGDPIWQRFAADDHRIIHLWRDSTFDQYVSRLQAIASGQWRSGAASGEGHSGGDGGKAGAAIEAAKVHFDADEYLEFRATRRRDIEATREAYGGSDRCVELEYAQLTDHEHTASMLHSLFAQRVELEERLQRQLPLPKIEYLANPEAAAPFEHDSIRGGFATAR